MDDAEDDEGTWNEASYRILFSSHIPVLKQYHAMGREEKTKVSQASHSSAGQVIE